MRYLSFEFHSGSLNSGCRESFLRDFKELGEEGPESAVRRIVQLSHMAAEINGQDRVFGPLVKCVEDALVVGPAAEDINNGTARTTTDDVLFAWDLPNGGGRVTVSRFTARAMVADVPDEEYDYDSELERRLCEDDDILEEDMGLELELESESEEEEEAVVDVEEFLEDVRVEGGGGGGGEGVKCGVCLEEMAAGSEATATRCRHVYHGECIRKWLRLKLRREDSAACPLCRFPAAAAASDMQEETG
ncbi:unnamed protein product [Linum trigynum]|uniref:RING-type domain-containing protein n=1 Tax=Linum trigynum TaxID=586398 RepID=A0AAV2D746_9ROSI